jgi:hypothetical protein
MKWLAATTALLCLSSTVREPGFAAFSQAKAPTQNFCAISKAAAQQTTATAMRSKPRLAPSNPENGRDSARP